MLRIHTNTVPDRSKNPGLLARLRASIQAVIGVLPARPKQPAQLDRQVAASTETTMESPSL